MQPVPELEVLRHLVITDERAAVRRFRQAYDEADKTADVPRCTDLVELLEERLDVLDDHRGVRLPRLKAFYEESKASLNARLLSGAAYHRTIFYLERTELTEAFEELMHRPWLWRLFDWIRGGSRSARWIMEVHGTGGQGKTMFLHWAAARRCVPVRVPYALIDFDIGEAVQAAGDCGRLLLPIVEQLNQQIPGDRFKRLIGELAERRALARQDEQPVREQDWSSFIALLDEARLRTPVVLFLDTLEELVLYHPRRVLELLERLRQLHSAYPRLRVVIAGRYDPGEIADTGERVPGYSVKFGPALLRLARAFQRGRVATVSGREATLARRRSTAGRRE